MCDFVHDFLCCNTICSILLHNLSCAIYRALLRALLRAPLFALLRALNNKYRALLRALFRALFRAGCFEVEVGGRGVRGVRARGSCVGMGWSSGVGDRWGRGWAGSVSGVRAGVRPIHDKQRISFYLRKKNHAPALHPCLAQHSGQGKFDAYLSFSKCIECFSDFDQFLCITQGQFVAQRAFRKFRTR